MFRNYSFDPKNPTRRHTFEVHGLDIATVNAIRRILLADIPVVGFSGEEEPSFEVITNNGPLHNEFVLHRLGLLPIHLTEEENDAYPADPLEFELNVSNTTEALVNVTTHDFKVTRGGTALPAKEVKRLFPANKVSGDPILITRLRKGETLHVKGAPTKKTARFHAGFSPVSLCAYHFMEDPAAAAAATSLLDKERAFARNEYGDPLVIKFEIEPEMSLSPRYLVHKALDILIEKVRRIPEELRDTHSTTISYTTSDTGHGYEFIFQHEDDTLGNILQTYMHQRFIREANNAPTGGKITYVGYYCPHPLDHTMVLRIVFENAEEPIMSYIELLSDSCRAIHSRLQDVQGEWMRVVA